MDLTKRTKKSFCFLFYTVSVYSKTTWSSQSPTKLLSGLSTLEQIQWLWLQKISSKKWQQYQEIPVPAWSLLLSHRQAFWNNHLARVPITPNQQGTMEMRDEML